MMVLLEEKVNSGIRLLHISEMRNISNKKPNISIPWISIKKLGISNQNFEILGVLHIEFEILGISSEMGYKDGLVKGPLTSTKNFSFL